MALDKEQQARLTFLAEAETYFGDIESVLLGLNTTDDRPGQVNIAMRAAHSVKGTAGMMGFMELSRAAHSLEDAFKVLRARQLSVDTELETLLLQGVDCLRHVRQHYQEKKPISPQWLATDVNPIFAQLNQRLGELTPEEEARLLSEENEVNLDVIIFTTSVEDTLDEFAQQRSQLTDDELRQFLVTTAQQMTEFGLMAQIEPFVSLCESVQEHSLRARPEEIDEIARQALSAWRRSHSLVTLGRTDGLPNALKLGDRGSPQPLSTEGLSTGPFSSGPLVSEPLGDEAFGDEALALNTSPLPPKLPDELPAVPDLGLLPPDSLDKLPAELVDNDLLTATPRMDDLPGEELHSNAALDLDSIRNEFAALDTLAAEETVEGTETTAALDAIAPSVTDMPLVALTAPPKPAASNAQNNSTVRVSVEQLRQINSTFEALILDRNAINQKLEELQAYSELMQQRMVALTSFNKELRQWYDQASSEGTAQKNAVQNASGDLGSGIAANGNSMANSMAAELATSEDLDALEFDRYSQLHLLTQDHMETIVKLEEVSQDIDLGLNEIDQAVGRLNYTSRTLKNRITQTQMRPFDDIVRRFPRVVRDWSVEYDKLVTVNLEGTNTLIEQFALDQLSDPLMHLLRNAFDHGIETPQERKAQQKPGVGTITLRAINRGNQVEITLRDDGKGIDLERVRDRVRQYDLPADQVDSMGRQELLSFIFEPGFSTSDAVTELSGRGFGMDVVRNNLKELQGKINVATEPGQGTTFTIRIPLSLSIVRVMLLERSGSVFALPVDMVQELIPTTAMAQTSVVWQQKDIPLVRIEDHWQNPPGARSLEISGEPVINHPMVVVVVENKDHYGLAIDRFWQEQEIAIRSLASPIPLPPGFSGVTILGDGRVIPVIEPMGLKEWILAGPKKLAPTKPTVVLQVQATRVLVVDDSIHARSYLANSLERSGYLVEQARDGREAVDKLMGGLSVDAVICDVEMPRLDGYGVLEELRDNPDFSTLPIMMLTSRSSEKHRKLAMNLGATDYFSKPYNEQELLQKLKQFTLSTRGALVNRES